MSEESSAGELAFEAASWAGAGIAATAGIAAEVAAVRDELLSLGTVPVEGARA